MPNLCDLGDDYPSSESVYEIQREQACRELKYEKEYVEIEKYLQSHPSSSYAEAVFGVNNSNFCHYKTSKCDRVCRNCGCGGLRWVKTPSGWRLYHNNVIHICDKFT